MKQNKSGRIQTCLSLTESERSTVEELRAKGYKFIDIFRIGIETVKVRLTER